MSTLTISLPDETVQRLRRLAKLTNQSLDTLIETMSAQALATWDMECHFHTLAAQADVPTAMRILDRLDGLEHHRLPRG